MSIVRLASSLILFFLLIVSQAYSQDSSRLRVSLLTCTPGDELYSIFGHSALRIIDSSSYPIDLVYNYGTFNFDDEGFYLKFIRGQLLYYISVAEFADFKYDYQVTNRGITEQMLNLSSKEKLDIQRSLRENLKEENRYYKYDFFLDNCTTRLRDIIVKSKAPTPVLPAVMPMNTKFRQAIDIYLYKGEQYWSKLGIDILLGAPTDAVMTPSQQQFLPDNLMMALDKTNNTLIVASKQNLYSLNATKEKSTWFTPMFFFFTLLMVFIFLSFVKSKRAIILLNGLEGLLFFLIGALGVLLIFMMTATDHSMTKNNFNIFWAWPTHVITSFFLNSEKNWVRRYFLLTAIGNVLLLVFWIFLPQQMNNSLIPLVLLITYLSAKQYFKAQI